MDHKAYQNLINGLLSAQRDQAEEAIKSLKTTAKNIYIFGAGVAGKLIRKNLMRFHIPVYRFVDNSPKKVGTVVESTPVISFQELVKSDEPKTIIIGTVAYHDEIVKQCLEGGIPLSDICFADFLHYENKEITRSYFLGNIDAISDIYDHCADNASKELFITNLLYQFTRDRLNYYGRMSPLSQQYYEPEIMHLSDHEVYFDCGAKDGDTALAFRQACNGTYKKIIAFEPDKANFSLLKENTCNLPNVVCVNAGVGETEAVLAFNGNVGGHSSFQETGKSFARIMPLDQYINEKPTLIKMDIEGFELSALMGAQMILRQHRPKLAICVYHKPCDIVELPKYVLEQRNDYRVYFRLYRNFGHDLVCYFV